MRADWKQAKHRQKGTDATWIKTHGKSHFGYKLSVNIDKVKRGDTSVQGG